MTTEEKQDGASWNAASNDDNNDSSAAVASSSSSAAPRIQMHLTTTTRKRKRTIHKESPNSNSSPLASSSSSSSSSSEDEDEPATTTTTTTTPTTATLPRPKHKNGWRVKLYRLNNDGSWDDRGTGRITCQYSTTTSQKTIQQQLGEPTLVLKAEQGGNVLLRSKVLLREAYQRQGDNIITWCEPYYPEDAPPDKDAPQHPGVDLALSFQDNAGCLDIWRQITSVQSRAADWFRSQQQQQQQQEEGSVTDMAHAVAAAHHASLQRQQQHAMWVNVASEAAQHHLEHVMNYNSTTNNENKKQQEDSAEAVAVSMAAAAAAAYGNNNNEPSSEEAQPSLPNPPTLQNLEEIADIIAASQQPQQRESLAIFMSRNDCSYLKTLLSLFPSAEARGDYGALATLAACIKTILLMNDSSTIELIVAETPIYEQVCSTLEYDPDLRDKANHRWFLRERRKFRTVVKMENEDLIATIHKSFRVTYLRDTLLRPTMDENSLSTLSSLQTFTHAEVVKGVMEGGDDSYLVKVLAMLGREVPAIAKMEWDALDEQTRGGDQRNVVGTTAEPPSPVPSPLSESNKDTTVTATAASNAQVKKDTQAAEDESSTSWKQHLAPQDGSLSSRLIRRRGAISFFRELFNMVRVSLQPGDKDDFYASMVSLDLSLDESKNETVNLLSLLASVLSDPSADVAEKGGILEIIAAIAMHDPSHIRRQCLDLHEVWKKEERERMACPGRPNPNEAKQIIFCCSPNDLLASLLFLMAVETDAGLLLQTSEIMRIILDTDMLSEHSPIEGGPPGMQHSTVEHSTPPHGGSIGSDQNNFLTMFYEHYVQWLAAPFQLMILHPAKRAPHEAIVSANDSRLMQRMLETLNSGVAAKDPLLRIVPLCAIRSSFAVELLSFCVRAHLHRMKLFLLHSRVLGSVLRLLKPGKSLAASSGDRCLKLAALRFLRSILSVRDEFYHRHIIQHNLFAPVFEAFRANPVGDNLVSSAIVEMCDFIHNQNIKSLIEYIVTKHLSVSSPSSVTDRPSLEDVATPYVQTLTILRKTYEEDLRNAKEHAASDQNGGEQGGKGSSSSSYYEHARTGMSEKALEDQRKFREVDEEESYFDCDDGEEEDGTNGQSATSADGESELHRTPRMFALSEQASSLESHGTDTGGETKSQHDKEENDGGEAADSGGLKSK